MRQTITETYGAFPNASLDVLHDGPDGAGAVRIRVREPTGKASICLTEKEVRDLIEILHKAVVDVGMEKAEGYIFRPGWIADGASYTDYEKMETDLRAGVVQPDATTGELKALATRLLAEKNQATSDLTSERDLALKMRDAAREASARDLEARREAQAEVARLQARIDAWKKTTEP